MKSQGSIRKSGPKTNAIDTKSLSYDVSSVAASRFRYQVPKNGVLPTLYRLQVASYLLETHSDLLRKIVEIEYGLDCGNAHRVRDRFQTSYFFFHSTTRRRYPVNNSRIEEGSQISMR